LNFWGDNLEVCELVYAVLSLYRTRKEKWGIIFAFLFGGDAFMSQLCDKFIIHITIFNILE